jgi:sugar phosphate isomerase/epimerase
MRPVPPDCDAAENLAEKLRVAAAAGVDRVDIYHYGMAPLSALDRVREALALAEQG